MTESNKVLLDIVGFQIFGGKKPKVNTELIPDLLREAKAQTVFTTVFPFLRESIREKYPDLFIKCNEKFLSNALINTANFLEHGELHSLMTECAVPYSAIKGLASAYYYPQPSIRDMGDVDYLVYEKDFNKALVAASGAGFTVDHGGEEGDIHTSLKRMPSSIWEQHRSINGIPCGEIGRLIQNEIGRTIETAETVTVDCATCKIPDKLHHGLIILLHMISHMTSEGIGLRHLCDWAVFADALDNDEFTALFEEKLRRFGLWKFAQIMTLVSQKYLRLPQKKWAENPEFSKVQLEEVINDIISGGNFGKKDMNRYREIKYISNRGDRTVDSRGVIPQVFGTLNKKVYKDYAYINRFKLLLPLGWAAEGIKYAGLLIKGERKSKGTTEMLREAKKRKSIYSRMSLFEGEKA